MSEVVVDCSVAMAWVFDDEHDDYALSVLRALERVTAIVPGLWALEAANTLVVGERRKRITRAATNQVLALLGSLPIVVDPETSTRALAETLELAREQRLSAYDASYLELAMRRGLSLATLDPDLLRAARATGVPRYEPTNRS